MSILEGSAELLQTLGLRTLNSASHLGDAVTDEQVVVASSLVGRFVASLDSLDITLSDGLEPVEQSIGLGRCLHDGVLMLSICSCRSLATAGHQRCGSQA